MSVACMGGVWNCGPDDQTSMIVLLAIADQADDYGFAVLAHETIALKSRCSVRTVIRQIDELESQEWLYVGRKMWNGKANVYFINIAKIGVTVSPKSQMSAWHVQLRKSKGDTLSRIFLPKSSSDTNEVSGDNPQPPQVPSAQTQVTKSPVSGDTSGTHSVKNHQQPLRTVRDVEPIPPTPKGVDERRWESFKLKLDDELSSVPTNIAEARFSQIKPGERDFDACFSAWWLNDIEYRSTMWIFRTDASDEGATRAGLRKYSKRIELLLRACFSVPQHQQVAFDFTNHKPKGDREDPPEQTVGDDQQIPPAA